MIQGIRNRLRPASIYSLLALLLMLVGFQQLGSAALIKTKAHLAPLLIGSAWEKTVASGGLPHKPWPWADTWPVARLEVPGHQVDLYVLWGAGGNSLAFGPGYETASAKPGETGVTAIGGHRDTHFQFLRDVQANTLMTLQLPNGDRRAYQVNGVRVVDTDVERYLQLESQGSELLLVTCYPFDALRSGGPLRYVVSAGPVAGLTK